MQVHIYLFTAMMYTFIVTTVLPPNSRFLGPGFFREFEIHELKIHNFPPNAL